jgi:ribonuclease Y
MMASELRLDAPLMKRCALLHDVGKALTHEVEGSHAIIGAEVARKYGEHEDVVHAIEAHHNEVEVARSRRCSPRPPTPSAAGGRGRGGVAGGLRQAARAASRRSPAATTGSRRSSPCRLAARSAVMVLPDAIDDIQAQVIARDIAKQVEEELTYPARSASRSYASPALGVRPLSLPGPRRGALRRPAPPSAARPAAARCARRAGAGSGG